MILLAQFNQLPLPEVAVVCIGILFLLGVAALLLQVVNGCKAAFGKQPPMQEQITKLRDEFVKQMARHEADVKQAMREHEEEDAREVRELEDKIDKVDSDVRAMGQRISENGEVRKQAMLNHIDEVRKELKADIAHVASEQTKLLLKAIRQ